MLPIPADIFTEPEDVSPDGLANLGPLRRLAGVWQADKGIDVNPKAEGPERRVFIEHIRGSYSGVMGLPLYETARLLQSAATGTNR
jgi:hypothetical protein